MPSSFCHACLQVIDVHLVVDPWSRESRGFGFVTMETIEDANCCLKYLDGSVLEGRVITVEKVKRHFKSHDLVHSIINLDLPVEVIDALSDFERCCSFEVFLEAG